MPYSLLISKEEIKNLYISGKSSIQIAAIARCKKSNIIKHLKKMGVDIRNSKDYKILSNNSTYEILDEHYFENIDTEEKSYWLGFLYADGCVRHQSKRKNIFNVFEIGSIDKEHLEKFSKAINYKGDIKEKISRIKSKSYVSYRIYFNNFNFCKNLIESGCFPNKTMKLKFPNAIRKDLYKHFIRGVFDGDGCISFNKYNKKFWASVTISGNRTFLESIEEIVNKNLELKNNRIYKSRNHFELRYGGKNQVMKFLDYIYHNSSIFLDRKYNKYKKFKELYV